MPQLLLGAGNSKVKKLHGPDGPAWDGLVTLDIHSDYHPDVVFNLDSLQYGDKLPFPDGHFSEIHAYEVLEHFGHQGNWKGWFAEWEEFHRLLEPGGSFFATVPRWDSMWAWGDPGHRRVISEGSLVFLSQAEYTKQLAVGSPMTDYRGLWKGDFETVWNQNLNADTFGFALKAIK